MDSTVVKQTQPHERQADGFWLCLAVGKYSNKPTPLAGFWACGNCLRTITDTEGKKIEFTKQDWKDIMRMQKEWWERENTAFIEAKP
jgi:hypothetical protein